MGFYAENHQALVNYFRSGAHSSPLEPQLGVEVEHFVVQKGTLAPVYYHGQWRADASNTSPGVFDLLQHLAQFYPEKSYASDGELIGLASAEASISLEPAAQIEISIAPFSSLQDIQRVYDAFLAQVSPFLDSHGWQLVAQGYHPFAKALDLPLIPKTRYQFMNQYFHNLGTHGERMMRASASTQVSVDYSDEADAIRKMRLTQALAPILSFITDNVSVFEGQATTKPLERFFLWRDVDNARCGSVPGLFEDGYGFADYATWLLNTSPIFVTRPPATTDGATDGEATAAADEAAGGLHGDPHGLVPAAADGAADGLHGDPHELVPVAAAGAAGGEAFVLANDQVPATAHGQEARWVGKTPARKAYGDAPMTTSDVEHLLSMFWPDVRLKRFVEIRPADSLPQSQVLGYTALIKGIFYSNDALSALEEALGVVDGHWPFTDHTANETATAVRKMGLTAQFAGHSVAFWVDLIFEQARAHLNEADQAHLQNLVTWFYTKWPLDERSREDK